MYIYKLSTPIVRRIALDQIVVNSELPLCDYHYSIAGGDFTSVRRTVIFNIGVISRGVSVPILDNTAIENTETFTASLTTTEGNVVIANSIATVSILDDDSDCELFTCKCKVTISSIVGIHAYQ